MLRLVTLLCALLPALYVQATAHTDAPPHELEQLQQLQQELHQELHQLREQLQRLDLQQLEYLEQSQQLRQELLKRQRPIVQNISSGH